MNSLSDIQNQVLQKLGYRKHIAHTNKYAALVKSAEVRKASGCNGFIMMEVRGMLADAVHACSIDELNQLYNETPVGQAIRAQGSSAPTSALMEDDIIAELLRRIAKTACAEARARMANKFAPRIHVLTG